MTTPFAGRSDPGPSIQSLTVREFRSWETISLRTDPGPVVLTGANGAGKTNLLEAVSFLAPGRGLMGARLQDLPRHGSQGPWTVVADIATGGTTVRIGTGAPGEGETRGRLVRIDGENRRGPVALAEIIPMIWLTPAMDGLFREPAQSPAQVLRPFGVRPRPASRPAASAPTSAPCASVCACFAKTVVTRPGSPHSRRPWPRWGSL